MSTLTLVGVRSAVFAGDVLGDMPLTQPHLPRKHSSLQAPLEHENRASNR